MFKFGSKRENVAEEEGFEPPDALTSTVFKTAAFDHSATPPQKISSVAAVSLPYLSQHPLSSEKQRENATVSRVCLNGFSAAHFLRINGANHRK